MFFLHHAKWEVEQLSAHFSKAYFLNTEFKKRQCLYLLAIDVFRIFEALMQYSITEHNESIVTVKLASEIRNIYMHVFFKLNIEDTVSFAKLCIDQLLPVIELHIQGKAGNIVDLITLIQESELYIKLLPLLLSNIERTLSHDDLVKLIVESLQFLMQNIEYIDDKIAFRAAPRTVRISCMALTIIGQYHRLLKESNANVEDLFKRYFTDKNELEGFLSFLNRCTYLRGMVGHEFNQEILKVNNMLAVDTVGELSLFKMLLSVKRYYKNFELGHQVAINPSYANRVPK